VLSNSRLEMLRQETARFPSQDLGRACEREGLINFTKTVKMMDRPECRQLTSQLNVLKGKLWDIVTHQGCAARLRGLEQATKLVSTAWCRAGARNDWAAGP